MTGSRISTLRCAEVPRIILVLSRSVRKIADDAGAHSPKKSLTYSAISHFPLLARDRPTIIGRKAPPDMDSSTREGGIHSTRQASVENNFGPGGTDRHGRGGCTDYTQLTRFARRTLGPTTSFNPA